MRAIGHTRRRGASFRIASALAIVLALAAWEEACAADGDLDLSFGTNGVTFGGYTNELLVLPPKPVVQPDGKILYCAGLSGSGSSGNDIVVVRLDADGAYDMGFNFDGRVLIDFDNQNDVCNALTVQADGKILVVGSTGGPTGYDFAVARLDADGSLDAAFGGGTGKTTVAFDLGGSNSDQAAAVALQSDGKIVVAGWAGTSTHADDFAVTRLLPDGTRDTAFNVTGRVTVGFDLPGSSQSDEADAVAVDANGRIVVGGVADKGTNSSDFAVARLLPNGHLDANFDADGRATVAFDLGASGNDLSYQSIIDRNGRIVMIGLADTGSSMNPNLDEAVLRLLPDGSPDASFGIGGKVLVPFDLVANGSDYAWGVVEDPAGRLVIGGVAVSGATGAAATLARLRGSDGSLDPGFGVFGKTTADFGGDGTGFTGVALQGTQIIGAGQFVTGTDTDLFIARFTVDLIFADGFE